MGSAFRTLGTLEELGFLAQDASTKRYRLGLRVLDLGQACLSGMVFPHVALPFLEELASTTRRSANMAVLDGADIVFVARASVTRLMSVNLSVGSRLPSHCTSMGKVLLADLDEDERKDLFDSAELRRYTARTITSVLELEQALHAIRAQGFAISREELEPHLTTMAAPVRDATGRTVAAINVAMFSGPGEEVDTFEGDVLLKVLDSARVVSAALGYRPGRSRA